MGVFNEEDVTQLRMDSGAIDRPCRQCGKTTRWVETDSATNDFQDALTLAQTKKVWKNETPVTPGQERIATANEREEFREMNAPGDVKRKE